MGSETKHAPLTYPLNPKTLPFPCPTCGAKVGEPCRSTGGVIRGDHEPRLRRLLEHRRNAGEFYEEGVIADDARRYGSDE